MKTIYTLILLALITLCCTTVQAFEVVSICEDRFGNQDYYIFEYSTETQQEIDRDVIQYCYSIDRIFIAYEKE